MLDLSLKHPFDCLLRRAEKAAILRDYTEIIHACQIRSVGAALAVTIALTYLGGKE